MKINEVIELDSGALTFKAELDPEQVTAMVRWFITEMLRNGAVKLSEDHPEKDEAQVELNFDKGATH